jgi:hypothetical protein
LAKDRYSGYTAKFIIVNSGLAEFFLIDENACILSLTIIGLKKTSAPGKNMWK